MRITQNKEDSAKFKVPSLRNVALTFPYMHDGRFWKLADVINHYATGIQQSPTLDSGLAGGISLSSEEQNNLINFLRTLTDTAFVKDARFAQPD
jgi:cytochrome c peroxidase